MPELDRRSFLKVVGVSAGAAAAAGCQEPVEKVIPYLNQPEEIIPGIATYYASACRECPSACSLKVKTREGRPIKVEGNPDDPLCRGSLCVRGQAGLQRTYDPTRFRGPQKREGDALVPISWEEAIDLLTEKLRSAGAGKTFFLTGHAPGSFDALVDEFLAALGSPNRLRFELFAHEASLAANEAVFGRRAVPRYAFDEADVVVAFGTDFLETWLHPVAAQAGFTASRRNGAGFATWVGPRLSLSGANCDEWLATEPGSEIFVALGLAREVAKRKPRSGIGPVRELLEPHTLESVSSKTGVPVAELERLAERIVRSDAPLALPPGHELQGSNATAFAAAVQILNFVSGAVGKTVVFGPELNTDGLGRFAELQDLAQKLDGGEIDVLLVHGANPVYHAPQLPFQSGLSKAFTVSFMSAGDDTTANADLVLPDHTPFEAWAELRPDQGVRRLQQPTIRPLFDTRATGEVLLEVASKLGTPIEGPQDLRGRIAAGWDDFDDALAAGGAWDSVAAVPVALGPGVSSLRFEGAGLTGQGGGLALLVYPSMHFYDGRAARLPMLQEVPDPVTKLVWGSYAELHPKTAEELGVGEGDVVKVSTAAGEVELPAFPHEAVRPGVLAIAAGQGHAPLRGKPESGDRDLLHRSTVIGVNALRLLPDQTDAASGARAWLSSRVTVSPTGETHWIAKPQATFDQEGRGIAQATTLAALAGGAAEDGHGASEHGGGHGEGGSHHSAPYADAMHLETEEFDPSNDAIDPTYRWGMAIDLDACTGCGACVTACNTENNIFTVGEELVRGGREMQWIRIERYVEHSDEGRIEVRHTPMLCQHCGAAPCESVCPVFATYHNPEGLNVMVPNRCIGTRYCGNNCPYKVRRFNYFSFDWSLEEPEPLSLNPDVTVRSKGVMEKCSFCVQRISEAKDQARLEGRDVRDGEVTPACAQTCPSKAIVFGNHKDADSEVSRQREDPRAYWVFHHLNTRPAVTYQKSVQRDPAGRDESEEA